jgi:hypothetical protein
MGVKKAESGMQEEMSVRSRTDSQIRQMTSQITDMDGRVRRAEDMARESKDSIGQLLNHTRNIEKAVTTGQQDMMSKRDQQMQR